jgi:hypothetical protein
MAVTTAPDTTPPELSVTRPVTATDEAAWNGAWATADGGTRSSVKRARSA